MMELKRASIITTPDVTPRNSMLFGINHAPSQIALPDQLELQDFLKKFHQSDDTMSIPEVEDEDEEGEYYYTDEEEEEDRENRPPGGSITPNEAHNKTEKTFDMSLNTNSNNSNPDLLPIAGVVLLSSAGRGDLSEPNRSQCSEPPLLTTRPSQNTPPVRRYSMEGMSHIGINIDDTGSHAKLKKPKFYSSFMDLAANSPPRSKKGLHKSTDTLDHTSSDCLERVNEVTPKSRFSFSSRLKGLSHSVEKENIKQQPAKGGERHTSTGPPPSPHLNQPPSVKNKVASRSVVV